jgi:hypothetical protein
MLSRARFLYPLKYYSLRSKKMSSSKTFEKNLHGLYVPSIEDIIRKGEGAAFGILFSQQDTLNYFKFEAPDEYLSSSYQGKRPEKRIFQVAKNKGSEMWSIFNDGREVLYDEHHTYIRELFSGKKFDRKDWITSIELHEGKLFDSDIHHIYENESSKVLIDEKYLDKSRIIMVDRLRSFEGTLYAAVTYQENNHAILPIQQSPEGAFELGRSILDYYKSHSHPYSFDIIPLKKSRKSEKIFSVLSSANIDFLDIDTREIRGSRENEAITDLKILNSSPEFAQVFYTGEFRNIVYAEISVSSASVESKKMLFPEGLIGGETVYALSLVFSPELDKNLVDFSKHPRIGE